ncbi:hypothetical protein JCM17092_25750 [Haloplanus litoreus]
MNLLSPTRVRACTVPSVLFLCMATAVTYSALRIGYAGGLISVEIYSLGSSVVVFGSILGGGAIAGGFGYSNASVPTAMLSGLSLPIGTCFGSLSTVTLGIGYYDSPPAILFAGFLLVCCVVNGVAWGIGSNVL